ncbi:MAG: rhomboid family intramembrane serine protease [Saprospiraceae bacterium]|nr:rhomboid family intramembrane serine protease [Saprospiraceae bacterium]
MAVFRSIWEDIKHSFRAGNMVTRLVILNFAVFVLVKILFVLLWMTGRAGDWYEQVLLFFCMPGDWKLLWHFWAPVTSIFLHESFWHFLGNTITLYLFGIIVGDLIGDRRVLPIYLLGGLVGNVLYFFSAQFMPYVGSYALGASGAIMALAGAALILAPDYRVMLFLLGEVKVKYIVLVLVLLDFVGIANQSNTGGHAAHLGGFAAGCWFVFLLRDDRDLSEPINRFLDRLMSLFAPARPRPKKTKRKTQPAFRATFGGAKGSNVSDTNDLSFQERLDAILDKIKEKGYENLEQEEKDFLYEASKK